jgi:hypothetical protein
MENILLDSKGSSNIFLITPIFSQLFSFLLFQTLDLYVYMSQLLL